MISSKNNSGRIPWKLLGIEAILVVLSVLLALGLNKWNENRSNRELSQRALQTMLDESAENCSKIKELTHKFCPESSAANPPDTRLAELPQTG